MGPQIHSHYIQQIQEVHVVFAALERGLGCGRGCLCDPSWTPSSPRSTHLCTKLPLLASNLPLLLSTSPSTARHILTCSVLTAWGLDLMLLGQQRPPSWCSQH